MRDLFVSFASGVNAPLLVLIELESSQIDIIASMNLIIEISNWFVTSKNVIRTSGNVWECCNTGNVFS